MSRFLTAWEQYVSQATDASWDYIHAGGLATLSTVALGRRSIARGSGVRPNIFVMITGPSSAKRKTTIVRHVCDILGEVDPERLGPNDFTAEYLVSYMRDRPNGKKVNNRLILPIKEFGTILAQQRSYAGTLAPMMCDLYDGDDYRRGRVGKKMMVIKKPRLSMVGACAYAMIEEYGSPKDWSNGFFSRMLWVAPNYNRPTFSSEPTPPPGLRKGVIRQLTDLQEHLKKNMLRLEVHRDGDGIYDDFATWIGHQYNETDLVRGAYAARLLTNVWKLALLYQIDDNPDARVSPQAVHKATAFAKDCWNSFEVVYKLVAGTDYSRGLQKLRNFIRGAGPMGVPRSTALRAFHISAHTFQSHLDLLTRNGEVEIRRVSARGPSGRASVREILHYIDDALDARVVPASRQDAEEDELNH
jgi:hypothetical protein